MQSEINTQNISNCIKLLKLSRSYFDEDLELFKVLYTQADKEIGDLNTLHLINDCISINKSVNTEMICKILDILKEKKND